MEPASNDADTESKKEQPKSKKPIRDAIARQILAGMKRHREATQTAGRLAGETGKTLGKIASFAGEAGRRAGEHVKKHGMKSLANEETEIGITGKKIPKPGSAKKQYELEKKRRMKKHLGKNVGGTQYSSDVNPYLNPRSVREEVEPDLFDAILEHLIAEGYADTNESALAIMANMSEEWREEILDEARVDDGKSKEDKRKIRTARAGRAGVNLPNSSLHTGDIDRRHAHRTTDDLNKDARDIRRGRLNLPQFQGTTGRERVAQVKKEKGIR